MAASFSHVLGELMGVAPLDLAEEWDNVGLLVEPTRTRDVERILLTIDLTEPVLEEALAAGAQLVVAYHPPIFGGLKRLRASHPGERVVVRALEAGLAIYSPHTALDAAPGGVNDWLAERLGPGTSRPIQPRDGRAARRVALRLPVAAARDLVSALRDEGWTRTVLWPLADPDGEARVEVDLCTQADVEALRRRVREDVAPDAVFEQLELHAPPRPGTGQGRVVALDTPLDLDAVVERVKQALGLASVRLATAAVHAGGAPVASVALCPGAGGSVLAGVPADLYLTGEMRHHDVLDAVRRGTSVLLCEHSNTERGYLPTLAARLGAALGGNVDVRVSAVDADPLQPA